MLVTTKAFETLPANTVRKKACAQREMQKSGRVFVHVTSTALQHFVNGRTASLNITASFSFTPKYTYVR